VKLYNVSTWDNELQQWTSQVGLTVPSREIPLSGLRPVLRELRGMGYQCTRDDPCVLVECLSYLF
jgi:hypothetical protein